MSEVKGIKFDGDKLKYSLLDWDVISEVVKILQHGEQKYTQILEDGTKVSGAENWKKVDNLEERYFNAAMRHLLQGRYESPTDSDTGKLHYAHAICNLMFLSWNELEKEKNNEPK